jgi:hypothetical protein
MALFGPERISLMNIVRLRSRVLTLGVIGALLISFALSFAFAGTAAAAPHTCAFTATSSVYLRAVTGNQFGALDMVDATVTKYTDGCGNEYGTLVEIDTGSYVSISVTVSVGSAQNTVSYLPSYPNALVTPIIVGNSPACGVITFQNQPYYQSPGYGSRCTPS